MENELMDNNFNLFKVTHSDSKNEFLIISIKTASTFVKITYWANNETQFKLRISEINKKKANEKADFLCKCLNNRRIITDYLQEMDNFINEN